MDRAGQLGRLRAWAAERLPELEVLRDGGWVLYGEWLWVRHGVADGRRCKVVRPGFTRRDDATWSGAREHNHLAVEPGAVIRVV